jgi:hypothetical protein
LRWRLKAARIMITSCPFRNQHESCNFCQHSLY